MCCRFLLLQQHFREVLERLGLDKAPEFASRYNIAPGTPIPAVRTQAPARRSPGEGEPAREFVPLHWGLTPAWASSRGSGSMNARAESLAGKPSFRDAFRTRRCVIPATGFYEWAVLGRTRQPWLFRRRDGQPFGLAGLWESWRAPDGTVLESCAIITTEPNDLMRPIHHRMPVMLSPDQFDPWLDLRETDPKRLSALLHPPDAGAMSATALAPRVNSVHHDDPACLDPAGSEAAGPQLSLGL
jgi:putative SOS response-associated peptidase YedK